MLDIIENDLLKKHLPNVSFLRLDGSVPANMRHEIVANFNNDPSIDILLLTTQVSWTKCVSRTKLINSQQVGGLGLNLTGADTVIFVEHDYNPMKDLQVSFLIIPCRFIIVNNFNYIFFRQWTELIELGRNVLSTFTDSSPESH